MDIYTFHVSRIKSSAKPFIIENGDMKKIATIQRIYSNFIVHFLDFILRDLTSMVRVRPLWSQFFMQFIKVNLEILWEDKKFLLLQDKDGIWSIIEEGNTGGKIVGKGRFNIDKTGSKEIVLKEKSFILSTNELGPDVNVFNSSGKVVGTFKSDLYHLKEGKYSLVVMEDSIPIPVIIGAYYINNYIPY